MLMLEPVVFASLSWFMYNLPKANENLFRYVSLGALRTPKVINCSYDDILHTLWSLVLIHGLHCCSGFSTWQCGFTSDIVSHYYVFAQQATRLMNPFSMWQLWVDKAGGFRCRVQFQEFETLNAYLFRGFFLLWYYITLQRFVKVSMCPTSAVAVFFFFKVKVV